MSIHLTKAQIRQECLRHRQDLSQKFIEKTSKKIIEKIETLTIYQLAKHIAFYHPYRGEVDLRTLWEKALSQEKNCYFPQVQPDHTLLFIPFNLNTPWKLNQYHIPEPVPHDQEAFPLSQLDLIFLPTVAFDTARMRLGMGKGYYDKTLAEKYTGHLIGVAYEWQKQSQLPCDPWDIPMSMMITEEAMYS